MKKFLAVTLTMFMLFCSFGITAFAESSNQISVYVTIADKDGNLALAQEEIAVTDIDNDDALTINDALYIAHEENYNGGAVAGYASAYGDYGLSLNKLWGVANGGSYGYYVNNKSAWSLTDVVNEGDYINAFIYTDLSTWSDIYCYFDLNTTSVKAGEEITLTLSASGYDSEFNPIVIPVENAVITVNGERTSVKTNAEGKATVKFETDGEYVISAVSDTQILVPPVCKAFVSSVNKAPSSTETPSATQAPTATENKTSTADMTSPKTGDNANASDYVLLVVALSLGAGMFFYVSRKCNYEK